LITIDVDPIVFWNVRWYGIMVALAVAVVVLWVMWEVRRGAKLSYETIFTVALIAIPSGVIVSRLLHVIDLWGYYSNYPGQIIGASGLTIYGAILGATLGIWVYSKFSKFNFAYVADLVAPGGYTGSGGGQGGLHHKWLLLWRTNFLTLGGGLYPPRELCPPRRSRSPHPALRDCVFTYNLRGCLRFEGAI
jgi:hypothetical protein